MTRAFLRAPGSQPARCLADAGIRLFFGHIFRILLLNPLRHAPLHLARLKIVKRKPGSLGIIDGISIGIGLKPLAVAVVADIGGHEAEAP